MQEHKSSIFSFLMYPFHPLKSIYAVGILFTTRASRGSQASNSLILSQSNKVCIDVIPGKYAAHIAF